MSDLMEKKQRGAWSSKFGFIMAAVGSAVGLGNIWRFPYIAGTSGGALFLILYVVIVAVLGFAMLSLEFAIGRYKNANVVDAFRMEVRGKKVSPIGWLCMLTPFLIVSYYTVIGGWLVKYTVGYIAGGGMFDESNGTTANIFTNFIEDPLWSSVFTVIFLVMCLAVLIFGVKKGIEKVSKILMPALFFMLIFVAVVAVTMPNAGEGLKFLFVPDFGSVAENGGILNVLNNAMGQAFFSLSVGMGIAVTYGSYIKKDQNIPKNTLLVCVLDSLVAIIAGIAIMPAVFSAGLEPNKGAGLVFVSLPMVFKTLGNFGIVVAVLFFLLILFAAWTSAISILEVLIASVEEKTKLSRKASTLAVGAVILVTGIIVSLSQNPSIFGVDLLDLFDKITNKILLPLTSILICLFAVFKIGMKNIKQEFLLNSEATGLAKFWEFSVKYISPVLILFVFVMGLIFWNAT